MSRLSQGLVSEAAELSTMLVPARCCAPRAAAVCHHPDTDINEQKKVAVPFMSAAEQLVCSVASLSPSCGEAFGTSGWFEGLGLGTLEASSSSQQQQCSSSSFTFNHNNSTHPEYFLVFKRWASLATDLHASIQLIVLRATLGVQLFRFCEALDEAISAAARRRRGQVKNRAEGEGEGGAAQSSTTPPPRGLALFEHLYQKLVESRVSCLYAFLNAERKVREGSSGFGRSSRLGGPNEDNASAATSSKRTTAEVKKNCGAQHDGEERAMRREDTSSAPTAELLLLDQLASRLATTIPTDATRGLVAGYALDELKGMLGAGAMGAVGATVVTNFLSDIVSEMSTAAVAEEGKYAGRRTEDASDWQLLLEAQQQNNNSVTDHPLIRLISSASSTVFIRDNLLLAMPASTQKVTQEEGGGPVIRRRGDTAGEPPLTNMTQTQRGYEGGGLIDSATTSRSSSSSSEHRAQRKKIGRSPRVAATCTDRNSMRLFMSSCLSDSGQEATSERDLPPLSAVANAFGYEHFGLVLQQLELLQAGLLEVAAARKELIDFHLRAKEKAEHESKADECVELSSLMSAACSPVRPSLQTSRAALCNRIFHTFERLIVAVGGSSSSGVSGPPMPIALASPLQLCPRTFHKSVVTKNLLSKLFRMRRNQQKNSNNNGGGNNKPVGVASAFSEKRVYAADSSYYTSSGDEGEGGVVGAFNSTQAPERAHNSQAVGGATSSLHPAPAFPRNPDGSQRLTQDSLAAHTLALPPISRSTNFENKCGSDTVYTDTNAALLALEKKQRGDRVGDGGRDSRANSAATRDSSADINSTHQEHHDNPVLIRHRSSMASSQVSMSLHRETDPAASPFAPAAAASRTQLDNSNKNKSAGKRPRADVTDTTNASSRYNGRQRYLKNVGRRHDAARGAAVTNTTTDSSSFTTKSSLLSRRRQIAAARRMQQTRTRLLSHSRQRDKSVKSYASKFRHSDGRSGTTMEEYDDTANITLAVPEVCRSAMDSGVQVSIEHVSITREMVVEELRWQLKEARRRMMYNTAFANGGDGAVFSSRGFAEGTISNMAVNNSNACDEIFSLSGVLSSASVGGILPDSSLLLHTTATSGSRGIMGDTTVAGDNTDGVGGPLAEMFTSKQTPALRQLLFQHYKQTLPFSLETVLDELHDREEELSTFIRNARRVLESKAKVLHMRQSSTFGKINEQRRKELSVIVSRLEAEMLSKICDAAMLQHQRLSGDGGVDAQRWELGDGDVCRVAEAARESPQLANQLSSANPTSVFAGGVGGAQEELIISGDGTRFLSPCSSPSRGRTDGSALSPSSAALVTGPRPVAAATAGVGVAGGRTPLQALRIALAAFNNSCENALRRYQHEQEEAEAARRGEGDEEEGAERQRGAYPFFPYGGEQQEEGNTPLSSSQTAEERRERYEQAFLEADTHVAATLRFLVSLLLGPSFFNIISAPAIVNTAAAVQILMREAVLLIAASPPQQPSASMTHTNNTPHNTSSNNNSSASSASATNPSNNTNTVTLSFAVVSCVACETALSVPICLSNDPITRQHATMPFAIQQHVLHHASSAKHRRKAKFMGVEEVTKALAIPQSYVPYYSRVNADGGAVMAKRNALIGGVSTAGGETDEAGGDASASSAQVAHTIVHINGLATLLPVRTSHHDAVMAVDSAGTTSTSAAGAAAAFMALSPLNNTTTNNFSLNNNSLSVGGGVVSSHAQLAPQVGGRLPNLHPLAAALSSEEGLKWCGVPTIDAGSAEEAMLTGNGGEGRGAFELLLTAKKRLAATSELSSRYQWQRILAATPFSWAAPGARPSDSSPTQVLLVAAASPFVLGSDVEVSAYTVKFIGLFAQLRQAGQIAGQIQRYTWSNKVLTEAILEGTRQWEKRNNNGKKDINNRRTQAGAGYSSNENGGSSLMSRGENECDGFNGVSSTQQNDSQLLYSQSEEEALSLEEMYFRSMLNLPGLPAGGEKPTFSASHALTDDGSEGGGGGGFGGPDGRGADTGASSRDSRLPSAAWSPLSSLISLTVNTFAGGLLGGGRRSGGGDGGALIMWLLSCFGANVTAELERISGVRALLCSLTSSKGTSSYIYAPRSIVYHLSDFTNSRRFINNYVSALNTFGAMATEHVDQMLLSASVAVESLRAGMARLRPAARDTFRQRVTVKMRRVSGGNASEETPSFFNGEAQGGEASAGRRGRRTSTAAAREKAEEEAEEEGDEERNALFDHVTFVTLAGYQSLLTNSDVVREGECSPEDDEPDTKEGGDNDESLKREKHQLRGERYQRNLYRHSALMRYRHSVACLQHVIEILSSIVKEASAFWGGAKTSLGDLLHEMRLLQCAEIGLVVPSMTNHNGSFQTSPPMLTPKFLLRVHISKQRLVADVSNLLLSSVSLVSVVCDGLSAFFRCNSAEVFAKPINVSVPVECTIGKWSSKGAREPAPSVFRLALESTTMVDSSSSESEEEDDGDENEGYIAALSDDDNSEE